MYTFPVTQLVKSTKDNMRLDMLVLDDEKKKKQTKFTFAFTSVHVRETFCQQIMQMKNMHSSAVEVDQISVFVGTWNMGKKKMTWYRCLTIYNVVKSYRVFLHAWIWQKLNIKEFEKSFKLTKNFQMFNKVVF